MTALLAEFYPAFLMGFAFIASIVMAWLKGGQSEKQKELQKRMKRNAENTKAAKEFLIDESTRDIDDKFDELHNYKPPR